MDLKPIKFRVRRSGVRLVADTLFELREATGSNIGGFQVMTEGEWVAVADICEYGGCGKRKQCFHYCTEHHKVICLPS